MKLVLISLALLCSTNIFAQEKNTLDINYNLNYKDDFFFRASAKLSQNQDWEFKNLNGGCAYNIGGKNSNFGITYDFWKNINITTQRYGLKFQTQNKFSNLNLSVYKTDNPNSQSGFAGRIDLNMKF